MDDVRIDDLVFAGFNSRVFGVHRDTGETVWRWRPGGGTAGMPNVLLDGDRLIVAMNGYLWALDARTGAELWHNPMKGEGMGVTALTSMRGAGGALAALGTVVNQSSS